MLLEKRKLTPVVLSYLTSEILSNEQKLTKDLKYAHYELRNNVIYLSRKNKVRKTKLAILIESNVNTIKMKVDKIKSYGKNSKVIVIIPYIGPQGF